MADCQQVEDFCKYVQDSKSFNIPLHKAYRLKSLHLHPDKWKESWGVSKEEAGVKFQSFSDTFKSISEQKRNDDKESCESLTQKCSLPQSQSAKEQGSPDASAAPSPAAPSPDAAREQAAREQVAREQAAREQAAREQAAREQAAREQAATRQTRSKKSNKKPLSPINKKPPNKSKYLEKTIEREGKGGKVRILRKEKQDPHDINFKRRDLDPMNIVDAY